MVYRLSIVRSFIQTKTMSFNDSKNKDLTMGAQQQSHLIHRASSSYAFWSYFYDYADAVLSNQTNAKGI